MKLSIPLISIIFFSNQLAAQTNHKNNISNKKNFTLSESNRFSMKNFKKFLANSKKKSLTTQLTEDKLKPNISPTTKNY